MAKKAPSIVQPVYQPAPAPAPVVETKEEKEPDADELRLKNIMNRRRGRLGTIATSLNGVLSTTTTQTPARKNLLGE